MTFAALLASENIGSEERVTEPSICNLNANSDLLIKSEQQFFISHCNLLTAALICG